MMTFYTISYAAMLTVSCYIIYQVGRHNGRREALDETIFVVRIHDLAEREDVRRAVMVRGPFRDSKEMVRWMSEFEREMLERNQHRRFKVSYSQVATGWSDGSPAEVADLVIRYAKPSPSPDPTSYMM